MCMKCYCINWDVYEVLLNEYEVLLYKLGCV